MALDRTQSLLPIDFGRTQKRTFDYARMGTTDLYAALQLAGYESALPAMLDRLDGSAQIDLKLWLRILYPL